MSGFTRTPNYALYKPNPNSDDDAWGGHLNTNADILDTLLGPGGSAPFLPLSNPTFNGTLATPGGTQTLSGAQTPALLANFGVNLAGTSTYSGNGYKVSIGSASDTLAAPHMSLFSLNLASNLAAGWQGSRGSLWAYISTTGNTDLTPSAALGTGAIVSLNGAVSSNHNMGGVAAGYGSTQFGLGAQWGGVLQSIAQGGSTYWNQVTGLEIDNSVAAGANVIENVGIRVVLYASHAVPGRLLDAGMVFTGGGTQNWKNGILIGSLYGHALDPQGYGLRMLRGRDSTAVATAAGGIDLLQLDFTGTGTGGGGFAYRSANHQVLNSGFTQIGPGLLSYDGSGLIVDSPYQGVTAATVAAGGTNFSAHDILEGADGSLVSVTTIAAGAVTAVAIIRSGWAKTGSLPANPVTFTAQGRSGTTQGSGCTLNLTWGTAAGISVSPSGGPVTVTGHSRFNSGIDVHGSDGANGPGSIYSDSNWGLMIRGNPGGVADVALQDSGGNAPVRIKANTVALSGTIGFNGTNPIAKPAGWGAATGTATRTTFVTGSVTLSALAEHVKALIDDLTAYGLIGP